jgi:hypothetical protein
MQCEERDFGQRQSRSVVSNRRKSKVVPVLLTEHDAM